MALIECHECKREISDAAKACPHCGAKKPKSRALLYAIIGIPVIFFTWAMVREPGAEEVAMTHSRNVISKCWEGQAAKSNSASESQAIAAMCENFEREFFSKYGRKP